MNFTLACPQKILLDEEAVRLATIPGAAGAFGAMPGHMPILCELQPGILSVYFDKGTISGKSAHYFIAGGFCVVHPNSSVEISAVDACEMNQLDAVAVSNGLQKAKETFGLRERRRSEREG